MSNDTELKQKYLLEIGLNHAWQWFTLHATQRLQAVYFFLLAAAFLSTSYVAALRFPGVAVGISALGALFSLVFYRFEMRIQELIKASEKPLYTAQGELARLTDVPSFEICDTVENAKRPFTKYSIVIRTLYASTGLGFLVGFVYAIGRALQSDLSIAPIAYRATIVLTGLLSLVCGQRLLARDRNALTSYHYVLATALIGAGVFVLVLSAIRLPH